MGDMGEIFNAMKERKKEVRTDRYKHNLDILSGSGLEYKEDYINRTIRFESFKPIIMYYPSTNKMQHGNKMFYSKTAQWVINYVKSKKNEFKNK